MHNDTFHHTKEKIIGGNEVDIKFYPHQVAILVFGNLLCSGSIITPLHILTSAHCFENLNDSKYYLVRSGTSFWDEGGLLSEVSQIILHEHFLHKSKPTYVANDIAILVLNEPLNYNENTQQILLMSRPIKFAEEAYVSGWGRVSPISRKTSRNLKALRLQVDNEDSCMIWDLLETKICGRTGNTNGACHGDSGGALMIQGLLAGIVTGSPSNVCGHPIEPMVFTSVMHHRDWIQRKIEFYSIYVTD